MLCAIAWHGALVERRTFDLLDYAQVRRTQSVLVAPNTLRNVIHALLGDVVQASPIFGAV
jgi:hypothetical protein